MNLSPEQNALLMHLDNMQRRGHVFAACAAGVLLIIVTMAFWHQRTRADKAEEACKKVTELVAPALMTGLEALPPHEAVEEILARQQRHLDRHNRDTNKEDRLA